jgi:iron complex outermembrane receptor protein
MSMKKLLRPDEAAELLGVSRWTIYRWVEEGRLRATKVGPRCLRVLADSVDELVQRNVTSYDHNRAEVPKARG